MTTPIKKHELGFIENTDGLVLHVMTGADEGLPLPPDGISVYAEDDVFEDNSGVNERWVLCWVRMPDAECEKCGENIPGSECLICEAAEHNEATRVRMPEVTS